MKSKGKKQNQIHENYVITITCNASKQGLGFLLTSTALMAVPNDFGRGGTMVCSVPYVCQIAKSL